MASYRSSFAHLQQQVAEAEAKATYEHRCRLSAEERLKDLEKLQSLSLQKAPESVTHVAHQLQRLERELSEEKARRIATENALNRAHASFSRGSGRQSPVSLEEHTVAISQPANWAKAYQFELSKAEGQIAGLQHQLRLYCEDNGTLTRELMALQREVVAERAAAQQAVDEVARAWSQNCAALQRQLQAAELMLQSQQAVAADLASSRASRRGSVTNGQQDPQPQASRTASPESSPLLGASRSGTAVEVCRALFATVQPLPVATRADGVQEASPISQAPRHPSFTYWSPSSSSDSSPLAHAAAPQTAPPPERSGKPAAPHDAALYNGPAIVDGGPAWSQPVGPGLGHAAASRGGGALVASHSEPVAAGHSERHAPGSTQAERAWWRPSSGASPPRSLASPPDSTVGGDDVRSVRLAMLELWSVKEELHATRAELTRAQSLLEALMQRDREAERQLRSVASQHELPGLHEALVKLQQPPSASSSRGPSGPPSRRMSITSARTPGAPQHATLPVNDSASPWSMPASWGESGMPQHTPGATQHAQHDHDRPTSQPASSGISAGPAQLPPAAQDAVHAARHTQHAQHGAAHAAYDRQGPPDMAPDGTARGVGASHETMAAAAAADVSAGHSGFAPEAGGLLPATSLADLLDHPDTPEPCGADAQAAQHATAASSAAQRTAAATSTTAPTTQCPWDLTSLLDCIASLMAECSVRGVLQRAAEQELDCLRSRHEDLQTDTAMQPASLGYEWDGQQPCTAQHGGPPQLKLLHRTGDDMDVHSLRRERDELQACVASLLAQSTGDDVEVHSLRRERDELQACVASLLAHSCVQGVLRRSAADLRAQGRLPPPRQNRPSTLGSPATGDALVQGAGVRQCRPPPLGSPEQPPSPSNTSAHSSPFWAAAHSPEWETALVGSPSGRAIGSVSPGVCGINGAAHLAAGDGSEPSPDNRTTPPPHPPPAPSQQLREPSSNGHATGKHDGDGGGDISTLNGTASTSQGWHKPGPPSRAMGRPSSQRSEGVVGFADDGWASPCCRVGSGNGLEEVPEELRALHAELQAKELERFQLAVEVGELNDRVQSLQDALAAAEERLTELAMRESEGLSLVRRLLATANAETPLLPTLVSELLNFQRHASFTPSFTPAASGDLGTPPPPPDQTITPSITPSLTPSFTPSGMPAASGDLGMPPPPPDQTIAPSLTPSFTPSGMPAASGDLGTPPPPPDQTITPSLTPSLTPSGMPAVPGDLETAPPPPPDQTTTMSLTLSITPSLTPSFMSGVSGDPGMLPPPPD